MLSNKTLLEIVKILDQLNHSEINRIVSFFNFSCYAPGENASIGAKTNKVLTDLRYKTGSAPFTNDIQLDMLQYLIDEYFTKSRYNEEDNYVTYNSGGSVIKFENAFSNRYKELAHSLKRDGYIILEKTIKKLLPSEIEEAKTESELFIKLDKYGLVTTRGHLSQGIDSHTQGKWAAANSQFRTFIESLLIDICKLKLPENKCESAASAINLLTNTVSPSFFKAELNEVKHSKCETPFIEGLWKRLHPEGSHPGLSDEEDCTFRYHLSIVFSHYLLARL